MPSHTIALSHFYPLVGDMKVNTKTYSRICVKGVVPFLSTKFPTLQFETSQNYDGHWSVKAQCKHTSLSIQKLDQYVDFVNSIKHIKWARRLINLFARARQHIEVLVEPTDLAIVMEWLLQNCKGSEYIIINRYGDCTMVCLTPDKAMRFKLWYPGK